MHQIVPQQIQSLTLSCPQLKIVNSISMIKIKCMGFLYFLFLLDLHIIIEYILELPDNFSLPLMDVTLCVLRRIFQ